MISGLDAPTAVAALLTLAMWTSPAAAQKTDVVTLQNGDRITGEIKRLDRGRLEYSTDDMGTLNIEWEEIDVLTSGLTYEVELGSGERFFGTFPPGAPAGGMLVGTVDADTLSMASIWRTSQGDDGRRPGPALLLDHRPISTAVDDSHLEPEFTRGEPRERRLSVRASKA